MRDNLTLFDVSALLSEALDVDIQVFDGSFEFRNHEKWDSMAALSMIALIDEKYDLVISTNDFKNAITLQDLYNLIMTK